MGGMFGRSGNVGGIVIFNGDISAWDVSSVTDMSSMFAAHATFNGDLSSWDVSSVTNMGGMFASTENFNGDLSSWDVSSVTDRLACFIILVLVEIYHYGMFQV